MLRTWSLKTISPFGIKSKQRYSTTEGRRNRSLRSRQGYILAHSPTHNHQVSIKTRPLV